MEQDHRALAETGPASDFLGSIEQLVRVFLSDKRLGIEHLATLAGLSPRTLQRRLAEVGLDYSELVDRVRFKTAIALLDERGMKLIDIAYELGYSDAANFTRAFKRWTGVTPSQFRQLRGEAHPVC